jgi:xylonate dehydratase
MKTCVISPRYVQKDKDPNAFEVAVVVFDGPEDYHRHIEDASTPM